MPSKDSIIRQLERAIRDPVIVFQAKRILEGRFSRQKLARWKRVVSPPAIEGALLVSLLRARMNPLAREFRNDLRRCGIGADRSYFVYVVADPGTSLRTECLLWRYWQGVKRWGPHPKRFTHATKLEGTQHAELEFLSDGQLGFSKAEPTLAISSSDAMQSGGGTEGTETDKLPSGLFTFSAVVNTKQRGSVGYFLKAASQRNYAQKDPPVYSEYLSAVNLIPVRRTFLVASLPESAVDDASRVAWVSVPNSAHLSMESLTDLAAEVPQLQFQKNVFDLFEPWLQQGFLDGLHGHVEPIDFESSKQHSDSLISGIRGLSGHLPEPLCESISKKVGKLEIKKRRLLYCRAFDFPSPLCNYAIVYKLPTAAGEENSQNSPASIAGTNDQGP